MIDKDFFTKILKVNLKNLEVNPQLLNNDRLHYQRHRIESRVQHLVDTFAEEETRPHMIITGKRSDDTLWIINGQHHCEAALRLGHPKIACYNFKSDGPEHEAKIFKRFQEWQKKK